MIDLQYFPRELQEAGVDEGNIYFMEKNSSFGVPGHMHVCIKRKDRILFFSTCSSKIATAQKLALNKGWDINTFPVFVADENTNQFKESQTYVNCNEYYEITVTEFVDLQNKGEVRLLLGKFSDSDLALLANGIKLSTQIPRDIKEMFE